MQNQDVPVNRYVLLVDGRPALTKYLGYIQGSRKRYLGIELINEDDQGKHDGMVKGKRYFNCAAGKGLMVNPNKVAKIFPKSKKKRQVLEAARFNELCDSFAGVGYNKKMIDSIIVALVHQEPELGGTFPNMTMNIIFDMAGLLVHKDFSDLAGEYECRKQYGGSLRNWHIRCSFESNGIFKLIAKSVDGFYSESGHFDATDKQVQMQSRDAVGAIGPVFHGSCHQRGPIVKRIVEIKKLKRFKLEGQRSFRVG